MKKIVLLCDMLNEMTITNDFLVNNMKEASYKNSIDCEIYAYPIQYVYEKAKDSDFILLTPLICFKQLMVEKLVHCPVEKIGMGAYAYIDGKYILDRAFAKISENCVQ